MNLLSKAPLSLFVFFIGVSQIAGAAEPQDPFIGDALKKYDDKEAASEAIIELGWENLNQGFAKIAMKRFEQARVLTPKNPDALWGLGAVSAFQQNWDKAIEFFQEGLKINPEHANLLADLSWSYEEIGRLDEALLWNEKARKAFAKVDPPDPRRWKPPYNFGLIYAKTGQLERAIAFLNQALEIKPNLGDAHGLLAIIYFEREQYDLAGESADKAQDLGFQLDEEFLEALKAYR